jgi:hypothetical protein
MEGFVIRRCLADRKMDRWIKETDFLAADEDMIDDRSE